MMMVVVVMMVMVITVIAIMIVMMMVVVSVPAHDNRVNRVHNSGGSRLAHGPAARAITSHADAAAAHMAATRMATSATSATSATGECTVRANNDNAEETGDSGKPHHCADRS